MQSKADCLRYASKKKMTPTFGTFYRNVFAAQLYHKLEGFWESEGFFRRALCSYTYKFQNVVQLRLQIFWSCIYAFRSCVCNGEEAQ